MVKEEGKEARWFSEENIGPKNLFFLHLKDVMLLVLQGKRNRDPEHSCRSEPRGKTRSSSQILDMPFLYPFSDKLCIFNQWNIFAQPYHRKEDTKTHDAYDLTKKKTVNVSTVKDLGL